MKLAGLKSADNAHDESVWAVTSVPATGSCPSLLLTGSLDETVKLWRPDDLHLEQTNTDHCLGVVSIAAHPPGVITASASLDSFVRVFNVDTNTTITSLEAPPSEVWQMQFDPKATLKRMRADRQIIRERLDLYFSDGDNDVNHDIHYQSFSGPPSLSGPPLFDMDVDFIGVESVVSQKRLSEQAIKINGDLKLQISRSIDFTEDVEDELLFYNNKRRSKLEELFECAIYPCGQG